MDFSISISGARISARIRSLLSPCSGISKGSYVLRPRFGKRRADLLSLDFFFGICGLTHAYLWRRYLFELQWRMAPSRS